MWLWSVVEFDINKISIGYWRDNFWLLYVRHNWLFGWISVTSDEKKSVIDKLSEHNVFVIQPKITVLMMVYE